MATKAETKSRLRQQLRRQREERYVEHNLLHLLEIPEIKAAKLIASYYSYRVEPDTRAFNRAVIVGGRTLVLPRINGEDIEWVEWDGREETLTANGKFHEPNGDAFTSLDSINLVLVPALAIDPDGYRLGQGGGYYDRALPLLRAWRHGVVYNFEKMEHDLPREAWDLPVNSW